MISRWSSPIPAMIVWFVSLSVETRKVGSSCMSFARARPIFSWSTFVFGSIERVMTGSGNFIASRTTTFFLSQIVSPVTTFLQADGGGDVARPDLLDLLALVRVHLEEAADPLVRLLRGVVDAGAGVEVPGVDAEEGELADEGVGHDLEDEARERGVVLRLAPGLLAVLVDALDRRDVDRRREVLDDRVEELLHGLVLEGRAADDRVELPDDRRPPEGGLQLGHRRDDALEVLVHEVVVGLGDRLDRLLAPGGELGAVLLGDVDGLELGAEGLVAEVVGLLLEEVDDAAEGLGGAPGEDDRHGLGGRASATIISTQRSKSAPTRSILLTNAMRGTP